jgi:ABC-2 type transport system ATP-binding protein
MNRLRDLLATRRARLIAGGIVVVLVAALVTVFTVGGGSGVRVSSRMIAATPEGRTPVSLDTSLYLPSSTPAPAVLLSQGFGGSKADLDGEARTMAGSGFVVLTYTARGFGRSGGDIHFASPDYEVKDAADLVSYLAGLPQVARTAGKPQIAAAATSSERAPP